MSSFKKFPGSKLRFPVLFFHYFFSKKITFPFFLCVKLCFYISLWFSKKNHFWYNKDNYIYFLLFISKFHQTCKYLYLLIYRQTVWICTWHGLAIHILLQFVSNWSWINSTSICYKHLLHVIFPHNERLWFFSLEKNILTKNSFPTLFM